MKSSVLAVLLLAGCTIGDVPLKVSADEPLPAELRAGDLVFKGELAIEVPGEGTSVTMVVDREDGEAVTLSVKHSRDGVVSIVDAAPPDHEPLVIASASHRPCDDGAFALHGHKWVTEYQWRFQASTTPAGNNKDNVETGIRRSAQTIESSRNDCGLVDQVSATARYLGRTATAPNIPGTANSIDCATPDGANVVGFGVIPAGILGVACYWTDDNGQAYEGDVKLSTGYTWFPLDVPAGCSGRFGVQAVTTHEFGHVFGVAHVSKADHPNLTMSAGTNSCTNAPFTLGLGDVRALRQLY